MGVLGKTVFSFFNPVKLFKAWRYQRRSAKYDRSKSDLELRFYSQILRNDLLHFAYFDPIPTDPATISLSDFEAAQEAYSQLLVSKIHGEGCKVLDIGCGMGGISNVMHAKGHKVQALTPNGRQIRHINKKYPEITTHHKRFENFETDETFDVLLNSESFQYINLDTGFDQAASILNEGGQWVLCDFFRKTENGKSKAGHRWEDFETAVNTNGWEITYKQDITANIRPTLEFITMYAERFLLPVKELGLGKLQAKKPWLHYMLKDLTGSLDGKIEKELASVDPEVFDKEKQYVLVVMKKK